PRDPLMAGVLQGGHWDARTGGEAPPRPKRPAPAASMQAAGRLEDHRSPANCSRLGPDRRRNALTFVPIPGARDRGDSEAEPCDGAIHRPTGVVGVGWALAVAAAPA